MSVVALVRVEYGVYSAIFFPGYADVWSGFGSALCTDYDDSECKRVRVAGRT